MSEEICAKLLTVPNHEHRLKTGHKLTILCLLLGVHGEHLDDTGCYPVNIVYGRISTERDAYRSLCVLIVEVNGPENVGHLRTRPITGGTSGNVYAHQIQSMKQHLPGSIAERQAH